MSEETENVYEPVIGLVADQTNNRFGLPERSFAANILGRK